MTALSGPIRPKRSTVTGETPAGSDLVNGEIAVNTADGKLFVKHTDGSVKEISGTGNGGGEGGGVGTTYIFNQLAVSEEPTGNQGEWAYPASSLNANNTALLRLADFDAGGNNFRQAVADNGGNETLGASFYISIDGVNWAQVIASDQNEESLETGLRLLDPDWVFTSYTETLQSLADGIILPNASTIQIRFETPVVSDVQLVNEQKGIVELGLADMVDAGSARVRTGSYTGPDWGAIPTSNGNFWAPDADAGNPYLYVYRYDNDGTDWGIQISAISGQLSGRAAYSLDGGPLIFFNYVRIDFISACARWEIPAEERQKIRTDLTSASEIEFYFYYIQNNEALVWQANTSRFVKKLVPDNNNQLVNGAGYAKTSQLPTRLVDLDVSGGQKQDDILQWNSSSFSWEPRSFKSSETISSFTPGSLSQSNMRGPLTGYTDSTAMQADGWTLISDFAGVDDRSVAIPLTTAEKSILNGATFIPGSGEIFDANVHSFFVNTNGGFGWSSGANTAARSGNLYSDCGSNIEFYCCFKSADLKGRHGGYRIISSSGGDIAIAFRFEYFDPYNQTASYWPVEVDMYNSGRIDVRYGTPTTAGKIPTVGSGGSTICGITSKGAVPSGLPNGMTGGFPQLTDSGEYSCIITSGSIDRTNLAIRLEDLADVYVAPDSATYVPRTSAALQNSFGEWNFTSGELRLNKKDYGNAPVQWLENLVGVPTSTRLHIEPQGYPDFYIQATVAEGTAGSPQYWLPVTSGADGFLTIPAGTLMTISTVVLEDGSTIVWDEASNGWISGSGGGGGGGAVASVNGQTGVVSLGVGDLDDTGFGSYVAPASGLQYPNTGVAWSDSAGGGGRWTLSDVRINRNDGNGGYDSTDYSFLSGEEVRIYQTDANGTPNGTTWTVTVTSVIGGEESGGWYGIEFSNQGAAPTGNYYFRLGVGILPADGSVLSYDAATESWVTVPQASGQVESVNDQTGVVSLGIQDMNDYETNATSPDYEGLTSRTASGSNTDIANTVGGWYLASDRYFSFNVVAYATLNLLSVNDAVTLKLTGEADFSTTITIAPTAFGPDAYYLQVADVPPSAYVNAAAGTPIIVSSPVFSGTVIPLADGDILKWDEADQKFKPAPQVAIADGSTTGSVLYWNGTFWAETSAVVDGNGDINLGGLNNVDLSVAATDKDSLVYEASSGTWKAVNMDPATPLTVVDESGSSIILNGEDHRTIVRATGTGVSADFGTGTDGQYIYLVNNSGADLAVTGSISSADDQVTLKSKGTLKAQYLNSTWNLEGDLYTPGASFTYTLEGATDYTVSVSKADGDLMVWDGANGYWTSAAASGPVAGYVGSTMKLQDISNVTLTNNLDNQYLVYDAASGNWISEQLDLSGITEDVQLQTDLDDLANVNVANKSDGDSLAWDATSGSWIAVGGNDAANKADKNITFRTVVGDYTLIEDDNNKIVEVSTPALITLPSTVTNGFQCVIIKGTTGPVQLGGTLLSANGANQISTQYGAVTAVHKGGGQWYVFGDLV